MMFKEIKALIAEEMTIDLEDIKEDSEFVKDLGFNSLEIADLVVLCEDKYDIVIEEDRAASLITVGDFSEYLTELVKGN